MDREDLPLLFASAEHRAWVLTIEAFLKDMYEGLSPQDRHLCNFGRWLDTEGLARDGAQPTFQVIEPLHQQVHSLALELLELKARDRESEALARLGELHGLRDSLLEQLKALVQE